VQQARRDEERREEKRREEQDGKEIKTKVDICSN
jgi:hypothetical protein